MLLTKKNRLNLNKQEYRYLRYLCRGSKNLYNVTLYKTRQFFFKEGGYSNYFKNYEEIKTNDNYKFLPSDIAQQTMKMVSQNFSSFFALLALKNAGLYDKPIGPPKYLDKQGFYLIQMPIRERKLNTISKKGFSIRLSKKLQDKFKIKELNFKPPEYIKGKVLKQVRILPKCEARYFEIEWVYEDIIEKPKVDKDRTISIDPGVSNFATILDSEPGHPIILDGKKLKSYNRFCNKKSTKMQPKSMNKRKMFYKRERTFNNALNQYTNFVVQYCLENKVGNVVMGTGYLADSNLGKVTNQNFKNIPFGKFARKLQGKCKFYGIEFKFQEEAYTSKCDHLAYEEMEHQEKYLGKRVKRGLFKSSTGVLLNADVNGALGILLKSKHEVDLDQLVSSGRLTRPRRITLDEIHSYSSIRLVREMQYFSSQSSRLGLPSGM